MFSIDPGQIRLCFNGGSDELDKELSLTDQVAAFRNGITVSLRGREQDFHFLKYAICNGIDQNYDRIRLKCAHPSHLTCYPRSMTRSLKHAVYSIDGLNEQEAVHPA